MTAASSLSALIARSSPLANPVSKYFIGRPTLTEVAADILTQQLSESLPGLNVDVSRLCLMEAAPEGGHYHTPVTTLLAERFLYGYNLMLMEGVHFFTEQVGVETPEKLDIDLFTLQGIINEWGAVLMHAYAQALCDFWNDSQPDGRSRWGWLSEYLQVDLKHSVERMFESKLLDNDQAATAMLVVAWPDPVLRNAMSGDHTRASLLQLQLDEADGELDEPPLLSEVLVLERPLGATGRTIVLSYMPNYGVSSFGSLQALADQVASQIRPASAAQRLDIRLYVPVGEVFGAQAQAVLEHQVNSVYQVGAYCQAAGKDVGFLELGLESVTCLFSSPVANKRQPVEVLSQRLPDWMANASLEQRYLFAEYLVRLAGVWQDNGGRSFLHGIPDIKTFAEDAVVRQIRLDHPGAVPVQLADIQVHILTVPNAGLSIVNAGDMTMEDVQISLADFALFNLSGRPRGRIVIEAAPGKVLPAWVTTASIEQLISRTDAGTQYLALLRHELIDDTTGAALRRGLFVDQLRVQLPMLALEYQLRAQHGFDAQGQEMVEQLLRPDSAQPVQLAQLGLRATAGRQADLVTNMYVISRPSADRGPQILYRPLFSPALVQYPDEAALFDAIAQPGPLQTSVLDWLSEHARALYGAGGFLQPHVQRFGLGSEFEPLSVPPPAELQSLVVAGDPLVHFYQQSVDALIKVAERQSVSSEHSRWVGYQRLGWTLFNALLPIVNGPLASAGWLIQLMAAVRDDVIPADGGEPAGADEGLLDLLFNVALVLLSKGMQRLETATQAREPLPPAAVIDARPLPPAALAKANLNFSWAASPRQLTPSESLRLAQLRGTPPEALGPVVPHGPLMGLYQAAGRWWVQIADSYYAVLPVDGDVRIVDVADPDNLGPWVKRDAAGRWQLDLSLRLRGGMPPKRSIAAARAANQARLAECRALLQQLAITRRGQGLSFQDLLDRIQAGQRTASPAQLAALRLELEGQADAYLASLTEALDAATDVQRLDGAANVGKGLLLTLDLLCRVGLDSMVNLFERAQEYVAQGDLLMVRTTQPDATNEDFIRYFDFVELSSQVLRKQIARGEQLLQWRARLGAIPGAGPAALEKIPLNWMEQKSGQSWTNLLLDSQAMLVIRHSYLLPVADEFLATVATPARLAMNSQGELKGIANLDPDARLEVLKSVTTQYAGVQDLIDFYRQDPGGLDLPALAEFEKIIIQADQRARQDLDTLGRELLKQDRRARRMAEHSIFRSARRGWVIGKARASTGSRPAQMEVVEPIQNKVIATFQQNAASGEWDEVLARDTGPASRPRSIRNLGTLVAAGRRILEETPAHVLRAWRQSTTARIPSEMEDILVRQGRRLRDASQAIESALTSSNSTDSPTAQHGSAQVLANTLDDKATEVIGEGRLIRIAMIKAQPPTIERIAYLKRQGEVNIVKVGERRALKKGAGFMQEFAVNDRAGTTLWYAHFHYKAAAAAAFDYAKAHLKTVAQRFDGLSKQQLQEANGEQVTAILRSRIEPPYDELFLAAE
jgi:hypothetical protein